MDFIVERYFYSVLHRDVHRNPIPVFFLEVKEPDQVGTDRYFTDVQIRQRYAYMLPRISGHLPILHSISAFGTSIRHYQGIVLENSKPVIRPHRRAIKDKFALPINSLNRGWSTEMLSQTGFDLFISIIRNIDEAVSSWPAPPSLRFPPMSDPNESSDSDEDAYPMHDIKDALDRMQEGGQDINFSFLPPVLGNSLNIGTDIEETDEESQASDATEDNDQDPDYVG